MNCYFICQKLSKFSENVLYYDERNCIGPAPFNLAHSVILLRYMDFVLKLYLTVLRILWHREVFDQFLIFLISFWFLSERYYYTGLKFSAIFCTV